MRITAVHVQNFKRIRDIKISPDADRDIILIGGNNGQGKSSTLDALTAAFGGKKSQPVDAVRHGAEQAEIEIALDGGLTIRRIIVAGGESTLEVRDTYGAVKAPQAVLDKIVSGRFLDPLAFLSLPAKEQRAALMKLIEGADRIAGLNEKRQRAFDRRTEVGRDLTKAKGELARLPEAKLESPIDVAALSAERDEIEGITRAAERMTHTQREAQGEVIQARSRFEATQASMSRIDAEIERLTAEREKLAIRLGEESEAINGVEQVAAEIAGKVKAAQDKVATMLPRRNQLDADLARANEHNRAVFSAEAQAKRRTEAEVEVAKLSKETEDLTNVLATIDARKAEILGAAKLPVPGLGVTDDGIELDGVPFVQASGAERLRVALGLAMAAAPDLGDVWIRDGALLDDESLELVASAAAAAGKRVWIERVGTKDPGVIVIADGKVAAS